jgi:hypothetical protein
MSLSTSFTTPRSTTTKASKPAASAGARLVPRQKQLRRGSGSDFLGGVNRVAKRLVVGAGILFVALICFFVLRNSNLETPRPATLTFVGYTNNAGQVLAIFRASRAPRGIMADGLWSLDYLSATGWAKPTAPTVGWDYFGWDGTNSFLSVTVETTNRPARIVMMTSVRRKGVGALRDAVVARWEKLIGGSRSIPGHMMYSTNYTTVSSVAGQ